MRKVILLGLVLTVALSGCSATTTSANGPSTFKTTGSISVPSGADPRYVGTPCSGFRGVDDQPIAGNYSDIKTGAQVVVKDGSGKTIALSTLDAGTLAQASGSATLVCRSSFALKGLPNAKFYSIHIGNSTRSDVQFTESEMKAGPAISLG
jgi:hypothetical protein